ncbi:MAG: Mur ligase domain-containing protein [Candidatus Binatia bacterium]|nr:Mur ligase domain-containing protein [Candidatus Binatia bacterium]
MSSRSIHMTAIGGVGMTSLAGLLVALGHRVRGSDLEVYPPASDQLAALGVPVAKGYAAKNLSPRPDLLVMGNAIRADNPEAVEARRRGIPTLSMPEALETLLLPSRTPLVIAGTHGKTTTSSFLAWVLETAGRNPGWFIGGAPLDLPAGYRLGEGAAFVLEGDEYDSAYFDKGPKFLHYRPAGVVLTSVEFDHADIYRDLDHVKSSFARLLALLPDGAPLAVSAEFPHALAVARDSGREFLTFAAPGEADWSAVDLSDGPGGLQFLARGPDEEFALTSPLLGRMNARNILGVAVLARKFGVPVEAIQRATKTFHGVRRRQQLVLDGEVTLIDDFAHHPTAIEGTLTAVRDRYPGRRVWALFDPRSNTTRRRIFQDQIADALAQADVVVFGPVHRAELLDEDDRFSPPEACARIAGKGRTADAAVDHDDLAQRVLSGARPGDVVAVLSNGAFGGVLEKIRTGLEKKF